MFRYRCLFVDHASRVFATEVFECASDEEAIGRANRAYAPGIGKGIELWRGDECIFVRDDKSNGPPPAGHQKPSST